MTKRVTQAAWTLLIIGLLTLAFPVRLTKASEEIIYIWGDGSVSPQDAPISTLDNVTYILTDDINASIVVKRSNIVVDGSGYTLQGNGSGIGIWLVEVTNVTIKNATIRGFFNGVVLDRASLCVITGNNIVANTQKGIVIERACDNQVYRNNIMENGMFGIKCTMAAVGNHIYHNTFVDNPQHASSWDVSLNVWDDGYPRGGNYWDDYNGTDLFRGTYQNITGVDGIGDVPYGIRGAERDNYPLMGTFSPSIMQGLSVTVFQDPVVGLIFSNVTEAGSVAVAENPAGPPPCMPDTLLLVLSYNVTVTAGFSGEVVVRIIYDDSGMTPEQEASLRMIQWDIVLGDVNADGEVDWRDLLAILRAWGSYPGHRRWNPSCDLNNDGKVDGKDFLLALRNYGEKVQCRDITTHLDIESNIIFGSASEFSIFGVTRAQ